MNPQDYKTSVLNFFDNHVLKYIITDLEKLDSIKANEDGIGGCAIPQAISTFAAADLFGYLLSVQEIGTIKMHFTEFLKNERLFPSNVDLKQLTGFFESLRDDVRSFMTHRYSLGQFDITRAPEKSLFLNNSGVTIFNVSFFTEIVINAIRKVYQEIKDDRFILHEGINENNSLEKLYTRIEKLKQHTSQMFQQNAYNTFPSSTTPQTTQSLNR